MTIKFAMPLGHNKTGDFSKFPAGTVDIGKHFRQPFNFDGQQTNFVRGVELVVTATGSTSVDDLAKLFAFVDGELEFFPADASGLDRFVMEVDPKSVKPDLVPLYSRFTLEQPPVQITYEGIDETATRAAISVLLTDTKHRSRKGMIGSQTISAALSKPNGLDTVLKAIFKKSGAPSSPVRITVNAGDEIALAASVPGGKRQFVWTLADRWGQFLNPFFHLQQFVSGLTGSGTKTQSVTANPIPGGKPQPMQALLDAATTDKEPRFIIQVTVGGTNFSQIPFSFGPLSDIHRFPLTSPPAATKGQRERRLIPAPATAPAIAGQIEVRDALTHAAVTITSSQIKPPAALIKMQQLWQDPNLSARVNEICKKLSLPCEILLAIISKESQGSVLAWRLEPLQEDERVKLLGDTKLKDLVKKYNKTVGAPGTVSNVRPQPPPSTLDASLDESDGRPTTLLHLTLNPTYLLSFGKKAGDWILPPSATISSRTTRKRHFFFDDDDVGFLPMVRAGTSPTTSKTDCEFEVDDQQLELDTREYSTQKTKKGAVIPLQKCTPHPAKPQAGSTAFYNPRDPCGAIGPVNPLTSAVQYTVQRKVQLRALYIDVNTALSADVTVKVVQVTGTTQTMLIAQTLTKGKTSASETATTRALNTGDQLSIRIDTSTAGLPEGIRVRVHLAPTNGAVAYVFDGASNDGKGPSILGNPYPPTGINLTDNVRGPNGNTVHPLTWEELLKIIEPLQGNNISPGSSQTLISTANITLDAAEKGIPNLISSLMPAPFNVTQRPTGATRYQSYFYDANSPPDHLGWLMREPNALLAGAAALKRTYRVTAFDFPAVCAGYNSGPNPIEDPSNAWDVNVTEDYVTAAIIYYNAAVAFFEGATPPNPAPTARFRP